MRRKSVSVCLIIYRAAILLALALFTTKTALAWQYQVFNTQRPAQELKQQLSPLFKNAAFSAKGYQLIVKAEPATLGEIKKLLADIDQPLRNLTISVSSEKYLQQLQNHTGMGTMSRRQQTITQGSEQQYYAYGKGKNARVISTAKNTRQNDQQVYRASGLENTWISLYLGEQRGYQDVSAPSPWYPPATRTRFQELSSGFKARVNLRADNQVVIEIQGQYQQADPNHKRRFTTRSYQTTLHGHLDQWIPFGDIHNQRQQQQGQIKLSSTQGGAINYQTSNKQSQYQYYLKVTLQ